MITGKQIVDGVKANLNQNKLATGIIDKTYPSQKDPYNANKLGSFSQTPLNQNNEKIAKGIMDETKAPVNKGKTGIVTPTSQKDLYNANKPGLAYYNKNIVTPNYNKGKVGIVTDDFNNKIDETKALVKRGKLIFKRPGQQPPIVYSGKITPEGSIYR